MNREMQPEWKRTKYKRIGTSIPADPFLLQTKEPVNVWSEYSYYSTQVAVSAALRLKILRLTIKQQDSASSTPFLAGCHTNEQSSAEDSLHSTWQQTACASSMNIIARLTKQSLPIWNGKFTQTYQSAKLKISCRSLTADVFPRQWKTHC